MSTAVDLNRTTGLITLGTHVFRIDHFEEKMGGGGHPYWAYNITCVDKQGDDRGKEGYLMITLSPAARFRLDEFLDAMVAPKQGKATGEQFIGKHFRADVTHEDYEGRAQNRFNKLLPYEGSVSNAEIPDDVVEDVPRRRRDPTEAEKETENIPF